jgi:plastocyanin
MRHTALRSTVVRTGAQCLFVGLALVSLAACDGSGGGTPAGGTGGAKAPAPAPAGDGNAKPVAGGGKLYAPGDYKGSVTGTVKFSGTPPEARELPMGTSDPVCAGAWGDAGAEDQRWEVSADGNVPHCFVWISNAPEGLSFDAKTNGAATVHQKGCVYTPHVFGVVEGGTVTVTNDDGTLHNVKYDSSRNGKDNKSQTQGKSDSWTFNKRENAIPFACDVHKWMSAWAFVRPHPFFAVSDADGKFTIKGVPDGEYELSLWHETWASEKDTIRTAKVKVAGGVVTQDFELSK